MADSPTPKSDLLQGTLDMLILRTLSVQPMHGYGIAQHIGRLSKDVLRVEQGSLYPALERLQMKGWVTSKWAESPTGRRARYYTMTASGRKRLGEKSAEYDRVALAIARVMGS
jgi:PadR family transcriptional regulator PadR